MQRPSRYAVDQIDPGRVEDYHDVSADHAAAGAGNLTPLTSRKVHGSPSNSHSQQLR
jgi:hypothetical protein